MTTDTQAVTRWDLDYTDLYHTRISPLHNGDYVLFTDHERVVGELKEERVRWFERAGEYLKRAQAAEDALAASRAEVEGLKTDAERYRWLRDRKFSFSHDEENRGISGSRWGDWPYDTDEGHAEVMDKAIDAAMEKGNV